MNQVVVFAKQVLRKIISRTQKSGPARNESEGSDENSMEAQTKSFRLWMWSSAAGLSLILISTIIANHKSDASNEDTTGPSAESLEPATSLLDRLPQGHVIAPIEPANIESLDSLLENHGYADLYTSDQEGTKGRRIARGLPIVRTPRNPRQFAVIVSDTNTSVLSLLNEPVMVVLRKKPAANETVILKPTKNRSEPRGPAIELIQEDLPDDERGDGKNEESASNEEIS